MPSHFVVPPFRKVLETSLSVCVSSFLGPASRARRQPHDRGPVPLRCVFHNASDHNLNPDTGLPDLVKTQHLKIARIGKFCLNAIGAKIPLHS